MRNKKGIVQLILVALFFITLNSRLNADIEIGVRGILAWGYESNLLTIHMSNPDDAIFVLNLSIFFNTECFTITEISRTYRSKHMDIFAYDNVEGGIIFSMYGLNNNIAPGDGPITEMTVAMSAECMEYSYIWDIADCEAIDVDTSEINCKDVDLYIKVMPTVNGLDFSPTYFDFGDVQVGEHATARLTITNIGICIQHLIITSIGCALAYPTELILNIGES